MTMVPFEILFEITFRATGVLQHWYDDWVVCQNPILHDPSVLSIPRVAPAFKQRFPTFAIELYSGCARLSNHGRGVGIGALGIDCSWNKSRPEGLGVALDMSLQKHEQRQHCASQVQIAVQRSPSPAPLACCGDSASSTSKAASLGRTRAAPSNVCTDTEEFIPVVTTGAVFSERAGAVISNLCPDGAVPEIGGHTPRPIDGAKESSLGCC